jgi:Protein of unknown function (DUF2752)
VTCPFHAATGLWCPGCGGTRALRALLRGHVVTALGFNALTLVAPLVALCWLVRRPSRRAIVTAAVAVVAFTVARNLPVAPLRALAP